jgi:triosephosphate isomerase (TIM)
MIRKKLVAANWKMNKTIEEVDQFLRSFDIANAVSQQRVSVLICVPSLYLTRVREYFQNSGIFTGAQDVSEHERGAYTGEISASMLAATGVTHCIVGHSERRKYHGETDQMIAKKVNMLHTHSITPVYCCGELLEQRESGCHIEVVSSQLNHGLFHLSAEQMLNTIIAYEPVWAIGTGVNATDEQAAEMHSQIRSMISNKYSFEVADSIQIIYGGSCNAANAKSLFASADVDGGLVGGASLNPDEFLKIIQIANG